MGNARAGKSVGGVQSRPGLGRAQTVPCPPHAGRNDRFRRWAGDVPRMVVRDRYDAVPVTVRLPYAPQGSSQAARRILSWRSTCCGLWLEGGHAR